MQNESSGQLRSFVDRIERVHEERDALSSDLSDIYAEAKGTGYDVKALKAVIARRRKDPSELSEHEQLVELYTSAIESGTPVATRARPTSDAEQRAGA